MIFKYLTLNIYSLSAHEAVVKLPVYLFTGMLLTCQIFRLLGGASQVTFNLAFYFFLNSPLKCQLPYQD